jgi:hypothetical protein
VGACGSGGSVGSEWCSRGSVHVSWCWFALLFGLPSSDSVIQPLKESNKFLELLRDVVTQGKCILNFVVQAPHKGSTFCRFISLNVSSIVLEFCIIGGEVTLCLLECLQFLFYSHYII